MLQKILFSNFGGGQNRQPATNLNDLLSQPEALTALLDEDSFISEFKSGYNRIKEYMTYERFQQLLTLVTVVGNQNDRKRSYKFPLTTCELLTSDNAKIQEYFLPSEETVNIERKVIRTIEKEVEQEIEDDDDEVENPFAVDQPEPPGEKVEGEAGEKGGEEQAQGKGPSGEEEEEFGEFVEAPPKKKKVVKVKQVVEETQIIKEAKEPLLFTLFDYFSEPINYTLTGYVCKILLSLLNKKPLIFLSKLFRQDDSHHFQRFFSHLGSRSMVDFLSRVYAIENPNFLEERAKMMGQMMSYLLQADSIDNLTNIGACVSEVYQKVSTNLKTGIPTKELAIYITKIPEYLNLLLELFLGENTNANLHCIPIMNLLLAYFDVKEQYPLIGDFLQKYLEGATQRLQNYLREENRTRLGPQAIRIVESLNHCMKADQFKQLLAKNSELFPTLLAMIKKYPLNNIFHNEVEKLLTNCLNSTSALASAMVESADLLGWLEEEAKEEELGRKEGKRAKKGYFGHLFVICRGLRQQSEKHPAIAALVEDPRFSFIAKVIMEQEEVSTQKMLGGLSKKNIKHSVMHSKEDILETYSAFLSNTPTAVQGQELEDEMMNPILLEELQKQLDGVELSNVSVPEEVVVEEKHKAELIEENEHHKSAFWKMHLDYDVDGLIDELV